MHAHSRRGFLRQTLGACWTGATLLDQAVFRAARARAQSTAALPELFDIEKVAGGVWAAIARPAALVNCNAAIFETGAGLMIVDTHSKPSAVASLVSRIRRGISGKPVRWIVNTHFHWDHTQGTPTYKRLAPTADIVSSEATRRLIAENGAARLKESLDQTRKSIDGYQEKAAKTRSPEEKNYWQRMANEAREYLVEMRDYTPELPNVTFGVNLVIHAKDHDLHLSFLGRGHTAGDIVVFCPQKKVIATGDLLHSFAPYIADGYPKDWPRTLRAAGQFEFERVIGGHGAVQQGRQRLTNMANYIDELAAAVSAGRKQGRSAAELQAALSPASFKSLADGGYGDFIVDSLLKHTPNPPGTTRAEVLAGAVKSNIQDTYTAVDRI
jgi:glyoxylase-like metal-dependent hydrolase (beta-lactamase superfamily II)